MTDLSPAQKALAAFNERDELCGPFDVDWVEQCLAAALEAVADQVVLFIDELHTDHMRKRNQLLAIAAELRGNTTTSNTH